MSNSRNWHACVAALLTFLVLSSTPQIYADPCGMVPPFPLSSNSPELLRVGDQITFVFFKDGVQDIVLRPGFEGSVDEFGMLIPFPAVPQIRKIPDEIFQHIERAIDPPEIVIDLRARFCKAKRELGRVAMDRDELRILVEKEVEVLREEAVGMYQVAVLRAEDSQALRLWMEAHQYVYPTGMDEVCDEYIEQKWCFVAVKANVGQQSAVTPRPGMREADATKPSGSSFEGAVQAMGFRFHIDTPVVPMRLSAFNPGDPHNIVYMLTDRPERIRQLDEEYVVRQLEGSVLHRNLTGPLPVKVLGGTLEDAEKQGVLQHYDRNPSPHNGHALDLIASNLLAVREQRLLHPFEQREKELLQIGERLGLRGEEVDKRIAQVIAAERSIATEGVLDELHGMTLTVIDGDFPREVIAAHNLTFERYVAPQKPTPKVGSLLRTPGSSDSSNVWWVFAGFLTAAAFVSLRLAKPAAIAGVATIAFLGTAVAHGETSVDSGPAITPLIHSLSNPDQAADASADLIAIGANAVPDLIYHARHGESVASRGWAIVCLADIGDKRAIEKLNLLRGDTESPELLQLWAGAAVTRIRGTAGIRELLQEQISDYGKQNSVAAVLLGLRGSAVRPLVELSLTDEDLAIRRTATAYLGSLDQRLQGGLVRKVYREALRYTPEAAESGVPWSGGALFMPGYQWSKEEAFDMTIELVCWFLWAEASDQTAVTQQLQNNLRDLSWRNGIGFRAQASGIDWVRALLATRGKNTFRIVDETPRDTLLVILDLLRRA